MAEKVNEKDVMSMSVKLQLLEAVELGKESDRDLKKILFCQPFYSFRKR